MSAPAGHQLVQTPNFTPQMMDMFKSLLGALQGGGGLEGGMDFLSKMAMGDEDLFKQVEAPARSKFQEFLGQAGTRFSGMGMGAQDSSAYQNVLSGGAQQLGEQLGSQRLGLQQGAIDQLLALSQQLLGQRPYETQYLKESPGFDYGGLAGKGLEQFLGPIAGGLGKFALGGLGKFFGSGR